MQLQNKRILLGVTGGIAAYKAAEIVRRLRELGADVRVVMTDAQGIRGARRLRVQPRRTMAVDNTFGISSSPAGVAHGRGGTLIDLGPIESLRLLRQDLLVTQHRLPASLQRSEVAAPGGDDRMHRLHRW